MSAAIATTPILEIAYETRGPADGAPAILIHGWSDDVRGFDGLAQALNTGGVATFAPWQRGFGATRFLARGTPRSGELTALAQDVLDFADALGLEQITLIGHDRGARVAYLLAATHPERVERIVALSAPFRPGEPGTPSYEAARELWRHWFLARGRGPEAVRRACKAFVRTQWEASGPQGWFSEADFATAAAALDNPDWAETVLYEYRHHWGEAAPDPRHVDLAGRQAGARHISVPTLVIHGGGDCAAPAPAYEGMSQRFTSRFERFELPGVGHFPHREAPRETADLITGFLERARSAPRRAA